MLVLALDTSSLALSCALCELAPGAPPTVLAEVLIEPPTRHGDVLPGALWSLLAQAGRRPEELGGLAAGIGPGSFTGLRVGLACAKSLAYARRLPLAGCSSLQALALSHEAPEGVLVVPTLEARRDELYARVEGREAVYRPAPLVAMLRANLNERSFRLVGPGAAACRPSLLAAGAEEGWFGAAGPPLARWVAAACAEQLESARYDRDAVFAFSPNYVQASMAEVALAEGRVGGLPQQ